MKDKYQPSPLLQQAIEDKNERLIKQCLISILQDDMIYGEDNFNAAKKCIPSNVRKSIIKRYEKIDGENKLQKRQEWTEEYFFLNIEWLKRNFNMKRVRHIRKVGKYLSKMNMLGGDSN